MIIKEVRRVVSLYEVAVLSDFTEHTKPPPNLWPYDYSFMRMSRHAAVSRMTANNNKMELLSETLQTWAGFALVGTSLARSYKNVNP